MTEPPDFVPRPGLSLDARILLMAALLVAGIVLGLMPHVRPGASPFLVGAAGEVGVAVATLALVLVLQPWLPR